MDDLAAAAATRWQRFTARLPMRTALTGVAAVWLLGCIWSFHEQRDFAAAKGFTFPWLLPLVIDGLAAAMAGVAYAASLDGRAAIPARVATALAVAASAGSNAAWAWERSAADNATVALAVGIPVVANLAFEVLLSELRRQVQRRRGQPAPVAVPYPRLIRLLLAPRSTFATWRRLVLEITAVERQTGPVRELGRAPRPEPLPDVPARPPQAPSANGHALPAPTTLAPAAPAALVPAPAAPAALVPAPAAPPPAAAGTVAPASAALAPVLRPATMGDLDDAGLDDRVRRVAQLLADGQELTGESVGEMFGCSARTGRRLLRQGAALGVPGSAR